MPCVGTGRARRPSPEAPCRCGAGGEEAPEGFTRVTAGEVERDAMHPFSHPAPDSGTRAAAPPSEAGGR